MIAMCLEPTIFSHIRSAYDVRGTFAGLKLACRLPLCCFDDDILKSSCMQNSGLLRGRGLACQQEI